MARPFKVVSCSQCGPEPANTRENKFWQIAYKKHHGQWPGYINPDKMRAQSEAKQPTDVKSVQFDNPGLWEA